MNSIVTRSAKCSLPFGNRRSATKVRAPMTSSSAFVVKANPVENIINAISVGVKNSPLNEGKKALALAQAGQYDEEAIKQKLDNYIKSDGVVVFSWTTCPFCVKAKSILTETGAKFTAVELDTMGVDGKALRAELAKMTDRTSMPNVFISGKSYGGCNDGPGVATLQREGALVPLLQAAKAL